MILESTGIKTEMYYLPPFQLKEGEIIVIHLHNGTHYQDVKSDLTDLFTGKTQHDNVVIFKQLSFVPYFKEPAFRRFFYPVTVEEYIKKNGDLNDPILERIYDVSFISKRTKVNSLRSYSRKSLFLYTTLSKTKNIIFDLDGQSPHSADKIYKIVKENVKNAGSAILIDWTGDMKNDCTKFIAIEWTQPYTPESFQKELFQLRHKIKN